MDDHPMHDPAIDGTVPGPPTSQTEPVRRGFPGLRCLNCGESDQVWVYFQDVTTFLCSNCDGEFQVGDVVEQIVVWEAVLRWVAAAPVIPGKGG